MKISTRWMPLVSRNSWWEIKYTDLIKYKGNIILQQCEGYSNNSILIKKIAYLNVLPKLNGRKKKLTKWISLKSSNMLQLGSFHMDGWIFRKWRYRFPNNVILKESEKLFYWGIDIFHWDWATWRILLMSCQRKYAISWQRIDIHTK